MGSCKGPTPRKKYPFGISLRKGPTFLIGLFPERILRPPKP